MVMAMVVEKGVSFKLVGNNVVRKGVKNGIECNVIGSSKDQGR